MSAGSVREWPTTVTAASAGWPDTELATMRIPSKPRTW